MEYVSEILGGLGILLLLFISGALLFLLGIAWEHYPYGLWRVLKRRIEQKRQYRNDTKDREE